MIAFFIIEGRLVKKICFNFFKKKQKVSESKIRKENEKIEKEKKLYSR